MRLLFSIVHLYLVGARFGEASSNKHRKDACSSKMDYVFNLYYTLASYNFHNIIQIHNNVLWDWPYFIEDFLHSYWIWGNIPWSIGGPTIHCYGSKWCYVCISTLILRFELTNFTICKCQLDGTNLSLIRWPKFCVEYKLATIIELYVKSLKEGGSCGFDPSLRKVSIRSLAIWYVSDPILIVRGNFWGKR